MTEAPDPDDVLYWPKEKIRALQDERLKEMVELCYRGHPFYQKLMKREGLEPRHIQTIDDLELLPPSTKKDFLADPDAFRLQLDDLPVQEKTLWKMVYTTGTTSGSPAPIYVTSSDHYLYLSLLTRRQGIMGVRETDLVANVFPLTPFPLGAYTRAPDEAAACGAAMVWAHTGRRDPSHPIHNSVDDAVRLVERHRATILYGVAGFVRRVLVRAEQMGADFGSVRMAMITGEASSEAMREDMRRRIREFGCTEPVVVNRYGCTEQGGGMVECTRGSGFHSLAPDQMFHEVTDPQTGRRLPDGESGLIAFSHLNRRGSVFLRYQIGDVVSMTTEICPHCGRTSPRVISQPVRAGDIIKVKGTLVNFQVLKEQLERHPSIHEYQIVVKSQDERDEFSMDELIIRLAVADGTQDAVAETVRQETRKTAQVSPKIEFVDKDDIFDPITAAKPRRVVDLRPARL